MANRKWKHLVKATLSISWNIPLASDSRGWFLGRTDRGNGACPFKERGQVTVHHPTLLCSWAVKEASSFCSLFYDLHKQWIATTVPGARMASLAGGARRAKVEQRWVPPSSLERGSATPRRRGGRGQTGSLLPALPTHSSGNKYAPNIQGLRWGWFCLMQKQDMPFWRNIHVFFFLKKKSFGRESVKYVFCFLYFY